MPAAFHWPPRPTLRTGVLKQVGSDQVQWGTIVQYCHIPIGEPQIQDRFCSRRVYETNPAVFTCLV